MIDRELLRRLPKAELHCHLDGSVRPSTLLELAREYGVVMPAATPEALRRYMHVTDARHLEDYLERFDITLSVLQTPDALERVAYELAEDAARDGVRYLEVRYAPTLNVRAGLSLGAAVEASLAGVARGERDHGITARVIICALRTMPPGLAGEVARLAVAYRGRGVVGFDLAGGEVGNPASRYADAFAIARHGDLPCTCHAGEGAGAESVREALHVCCANRIGHGTHLIDDERLTEYCNDLRVPIEVCLTSNVQTHAVTAYETHPLRAYFDRGLNVTLNTDNRLMSATTLTDEYEHAAIQLGFTFDELARIALNGFESAFLEWPERRMMVEAARREIEALRGAAA